MKRIVRVASLLAFAGCTTTSTTSSTTATTAPKTNEPQKMAITNVIPFDLAACGARELTLSPLTAEVLTGAMLSLNPAVQECFINVTARDGQPIDLKAKVTVSEAGPAVEVSGTGASAQGKACIEAAYKKLPLAALPAGSKPISAEIPLGAGPQVVRLGDNAANDVAGALRLAQPTFCECYAKLGTKAPPSLKADVEVSGEGASKVTFGAQDELTTCLTAKMQAVPQAKVQTKLGWPLLLKNSYATEVDASAPAALRFQQLDGMRGQRTADVLIAAGQRVTAALAFDELAQKYKKKPAKGMLEELKTKCEAVVAGDDKQIAAVKGLVAVLQDSQKLVQEEKAKDAQWAAVEGQLAQQLTTSTAEVVRVEDQKKNDLNACPKTKY
ncbi:MAG: hypothetical protein ACOZQL_04475 [Myxococcota bacterium]